MDGQLEYDCNYRILEVVYLEQSNFYPQYSTKNNDPKFEPNWIAIRNEKTKLAFSNTYKEAYAVLKIHRDICEKRIVRDKIVHPVTFI